MRNFLKIADGVDFMPLLHAVIAQPELWNQENLRTTYPDTPHAQADDIWLRWKDISHLDPAMLMSSLENINYPALHKLPQVRPILFDLLRRVEGEAIGHVMVTRLAPGKRIEPHEDAGRYAELYRRYHVPLQNSPGSVFNCGDESVYMRPGECWMFDNRLTHSVVNNSIEDRITLIIDIRPLC